MNNKSIKSTLITAGLAVGLAVFSQSTQKIGLVELPVKVADVQNVQGFFGQRIALNRNTYLKNFPINKYVDFIANRQQMEWDWTRAEQHGKWLESAYLSAIQSGDKELLDKAKKVLHRIIGSQESDGYLGATAKSYRSPQRPIRGIFPDLFWPGQTGVLAVQDIEGS